MKVYEIKNKNYETKKVIAHDMEVALNKYKAHLRDAISINFNHLAIFASITSCVCLGEYNANEYIK